ncbi:NAD(P)-binding protein [Pyrrhoderma noxium]|uniref:NAD(P)-binding protein n=1 Tax=Pyrrhoderma noxium TaxID=2282107 RepID=A0A286UV45_9AGAM|nr:NAD(P)-binding protein [Pyrrhoderma noxium]
MACNIPDDKLLEFSHRVKDQVVVITGAANGIGREIALTLAGHGAKVVIGDIDVKGAINTVEEIKKLGSDGISIACNVLEFDHLSSLFQLALRKFGRIDVVIPNAGVTEIGDFMGVRDGQPQQPNLKTLDVNLVSVIYTTHLAHHYLSKNTNRDSLKSIVLIASMGSMSGIPGAPIYAASKHAIIGFMGSLSYEFEREGIRIAAVCPWFADTAIVPAHLRIFFAGVPFVPIPKIAGAVLLAATDKVPDTQGATYTLPDEREVLRIPAPQINEGVYQIMNNRAKRLIGLKQSLKTIAAVFKILGLFTLKLGLVCAIGFKAYQLAKGKAFF